MNKKTGSKMLAKGVNALVYADYVASSRKMRFTSYCVDNEFVEIEVNSKYLYIYNFMIAFNMEPFHFNNHIYIKLK